MSTGDMVPPTQRDTKRLFTAAEKQALWTRQHATCPSCRQALDGGFDAHHVVAHASGGSTTLDNAVLLCRPCHRKAHEPKPITLRSWQADGLEAVASKRIAAIDACPGSGKTTFAGAWVAQRFVRTRTFVVVLSPSEPLKVSWQRHLARTFGVQLSMSMFDNYEFDGASLCYQGVNAALLTTIRRRKESGCKVLVVLDECHHGSTKNTWGNGSGEVLALADSALLLTGTPFRTDKKTIPGLTYREIDGERKVFPDYSYTYREAVRSGVCRPVYFHFNDGLAEGEKRGKPFKGRLSEASGEVLSNVRRALFSGDSEHLANLIESATGHIERIRRSNPRAGALLVCRPAEAGREESEARSVERAALIVAERNAWAARPTIVTSREVDAADRIETFRNSTDPFLVAINMVSEGVDVPRLQVLCLLRATESPVLFMQLIGRVIRQSSPDVDEEAHVYLSDTPEHRRFAESIEDARDAALEERESETRTADPPEDISTPRVDDFWVTHVESIDTGIVVAGVTFPPQWATLFRAHKHALEDDARCEVRHPIVVSSLRMLNAEFKAWFDAQDGDRVLVDQHESDEPVNMEVESKALRMTLKRMSDEIGGKLVRLGDPRRDQDLFKHVGKTITQGAGFRRRDEAVSRLGVVAAHRKMIAFAEGWLADLRRGAAS